MNIRIRDIAISTACMSALLVGSASLPALAAITNNAVTQNAVTQNGLSMNAVSPNATAPVEAAIRDLNGVSIDAVVLPPNAGQ